MINTRFTAEAGYYHHLRMSLLRLATGAPARVLEIGCGAGQSLAYFKGRGAVWTGGIELVPEVAEIARANPGVDDVVVGDVERMDLGYAPGSLDLIIVGHVLEHVADPWEVLRRLRPLLSPRGQIIGSLPNIRHFQVSLPLLLRGEWRYQDDGILDWTHLRFFTRKTIQELLTSTGFRVMSLAPELNGRKVKLFNLMTFGRFRHLLGFTYNFSAVPAAPPPSDTPGGDRT